MQQTQTYPKATVADETVIDYLNKAKELTARYIKKHGEITDSISVVKWLEAMKPNIESSTWRYYKASLVCYFDKTNQSETAAALRKIQSDGCKVSSSTQKKEKKTSSNKKKSVSEREELLIVEHFKSTEEESYWSRPVHAFFKATLATGLRPIEWQQSQLISDDSGAPILKVKNAKNTNNRSHGKYRHLHLSDISDEDMLFIRINLQYTSPIHGWNGPNGKLSSFNDYYKYIRAHMYRTTKKLFPCTAKRVSIYSCRHQMIANLKKAAFTLAEIAALVGHGTDETASAHYGRAKYGRSRKGLPKPDPQEVLKIRPVYEGRPQPKTTIGIK